MRLCVTSYFWHRIAIDISVVSNRLSINNTDQIVMTEDGELEWKAEQCTIFQELGLI